jgi:transcriptional regulator with XRE-family HTH domain
LTQTEFAEILGVSFTTVSRWEKGINSIFLNDKYIIAFNEEWIEQANQLEIQVTCFHESRHAFQWKVINSEYTGTEVVDSLTIQKWSDEMSNYNSPTKKDIPEEEYLKQAIEIDAIAFAHKMMLEHFGVKTVIPECIKNNI